MVETHAFLEFEKPIAELEGKIQELRHLSDDSGIRIADEVERLQNRVDRLLVPNLRQADSVAKGSGGPASRASALPRLHRRADRRVHAASGRSRLRRGSGGRRRPRPVSRPVRGRSRPREGRRHRFADTAQFRDGAAGGVSQGAAADAARGSLRTSGDHFRRHGRRLSGRRRRRARPGPRRSRVRSRPCSI